VSIRSTIVQWANWWADPGEYRVYPSHLISFFKLAGCAQVPSEKDATESMKLPYGAYLGGQKEANIRHWCGIFAVYLLRNYCGVTGVSWNLNGTGLNYDGKSVGWRDGTAGIQPGDIAVITKGQHHFIVTGVDEATNTLTSVDGNAGNQMIKRKNKFIRYSSKWGNKNYSSEATRITPYGYYKILG
jgi:hypothetical protein